jgi:sulfite reductase (ferredoxin)
VPDAVERWLRLYEAERTQGEEFNDFVERIGVARFEQEVAELAMPAEFNLETMDQFIDWNRAEPYKVERGEGECAI